jgi:hypothetical protein
VRVTIAFDVDGTLETSAGPVTIQRLGQLRAAGANVVIVSPSEARPRQFNESLGGATRSANLLAAKREWPAELYLYVSDNNDRADAEAAGFTYIEHTEFR